MEERFCQSLNSICVAVSTDKNYEDRCRCFVNSILANTSNIDVLVRYIGKDRSITYSDNRVRVLYDNVDLETKKTNMFTGFDTSSPRLHNLRKRLYSDALAYSVHSKYKNALELLGSHYKYLIISDADTIVRGSLDLLISDLKGYDIIIKSVSVDPRSKNIFTWADKNWTDKGSLVYEEGFFAFQNNNKMYN